MAAGYVLFANRVFINTPSNAIEIIISGVTDVQCIVDTINHYWCQYESRHGKKNLYDIQTARLEMDALLPFSYPGDTLYHAGNSTPAAYSSICSK